MYEHRRVGGSHQRRMPETKAYAAARTNTHTRARDSGKVLTEDAKKKKDEQ